MRRVADLSTLTEADWLALRKRGIGSSDAAAVLGLSPWTSPFTLYQEKLGELEERPDTEAMRWGRLLEPLVAEEYARETGRELVNPRILAQHDDHDFMLATPDRFAFVDQRNVVVEIKTASYLQAESWAEEPPLIYQVQLQHLLAVTGCLTGTLVVLLGGQRLRWKDIERNERFIAILIERESAFWRQVELRDPPRADGSASTSEALRALYPRDTGQTIALPVEAEELDRQRHDLRVKLAEHQDALDGVENQLKAMLGTASRGTLPGGVSYSWKTRSRREHVVPASEFRMFLRHEDRRR